MAFDPARTRATAPRMLGGYAMWDLSSEIEDLVL